MSQAIFSNLTNSGSGRELMNYEHLIVEENAAIARITLNRPERRNALSLALMKELIVCLRSIGAARQARVVVLAAAGSVFSSGHDLGEMRGRALEEYRAICSMCALS